METTLSRRTRLIATLAVVMLSCAFPTMATINVVSYWRMGELDTNAVPGTTAVTAVDSIGTNNLTYTGSAIYKANAVIPPNSGSTISVDFSNAAYALGPIVATNIDNFGIEAWVKPDSVGSLSIMLYNGNTATSGWGIYVDPTTHSYTGLLGGIATLTSSANNAVSNVWADVALVRQNGTTTFYVNGVAQSTSTKAPNIPAGNFAIAAPPQSQASENFSGTVDEARVFTFTAGQFSSTDLMISTAINVSASQLTESPGAGSDGFLISTPAAWTASANVSWIHLGLSSGTGSTRVGFTFDANPGTTRHGAVQIGNRLLTITQAGSTYVTAPISIQTLATGGINDLALDSGGNAYFTDASIGAVRVWYSTGRTTGVIYQGIGQINGVSVDSVGNVYVSSGGGGGPQKWTAPNGPINYMLYYGIDASGIVGDSSGHVYFSDHTSNTVEQVIAQTGVRLPMPALNNPQGVREDFFGNVYVADAGDNKIAEWTQANNTAAFVVTSGLNGPHGLSLDWAGNIYISDYGSGQIKKWSVSGGGVSSVITGLSNPAGVGVDQWGNIFFTDGNASLKELPRALVDPTARSETAAPGSDSLSPVLPSDVDLNKFPPTSDSSWLTISSKANQTVTFSFTANPGPARTGHITLMGQSISVTQSAASVVLGTTNLLEGPAADTDDVILAITPCGIPWTATCSAPWLTVETPSGVGSSNVLFAFEGNPGPPRTATIQVNNATVPVTQAGTNYVSAPGLYVLSTLPAQPGGIAVDPAGNVFFTDSTKAYRWTPTNTTAIVTGLSTPEGLALDGAGNLYIADNEHNAIKKWVAASNTVTTLVSAGIQNPWGIAVDASTNVYFVDIGHNAVKEWVAASNLVITLVSSGLSGPRGLAMDVAGNIYTANKTDNSIKKWTAATGILTTLSSAFNEPQGVAVDGSGNLFIADYSNNAIEKWNSTSGNLTTITTSVSIPLNCAVDSVGNLFIADYGNGRILTSPHAFVDPTPHSEGPLGGLDALSQLVPTNFSLTGFYTPTSDQAWLTLTGIANGVVNFSCLPLGTNRVGHIQLLGQSIVISQMGDIATYGTTNLLEGASNGIDSVVLGVFPQSTIWQTTTTNSWLHISNSVGTGNATLVFGFDANPGATRVGAISNLNQVITITQAGSNYVASGSWTSLIVSNVSSPAGVAVDAAGNVFYSDTNNNVIKEWVQSSNVVTTVVSSGLLQPLGIAMDTASNIYIADSKHNAIKKWVAASKTLTTLVSSGLSAPNAVAVDVSGNVYIADSGNNVVKKWTATNNSVSPLITSITGLVGVTVDAAGNVYIASQSGTPLSEWISASNNLIPIPTPGLTQARSVFVDGSGNIFMSETNGSIYELTGATQTTNIFTLPGSANPAAVTTDAAGNLYVADQSTGNQVVYELPHAFVMPVSYTFSANAGAVVLPPILPATQALMPPFAPTVDQPWLTISNMAGTVTVSYDGNFDSGSRTGHVDVLGQLYPFTQQATFVTLALTNVLEGPAAGADSISIFGTPLNVPLTASPPVGTPWLHLASTSSTAPTNFAFSFDANTGPTRTASFALNDQTVLITQAGSNYVQAGAVVIEASNSITALASDNAGNIYFSATDNQIYKWSPITQSMTYLTAGAANALAIDPNGNVVGLTPPNTAFEWFAASNTTRTVWTNMNSGAQAIAIGADRDGNFYIQNLFGYLYQWSPDWTTSSNMTPFYGGGLETEIVSDFAGNLFVGDGVDVKELQANGGGIVTIPYNIAAGNASVDGKGNLYGSDGYSSATKWVWATGNVVPLTTSPVTTINYIQAVDLWGDFYFESGTQISLEVIPNAFVDTTPKPESAGAGNDTLPVVLSQKLTLDPSFIPISDQPWLTITGVTNGVTSFAFTANTTGSSRIAHITVFGKSVAVTQPSLPLLPPMIINPARMGAGTFQFSITNVDTNAPPTVLTSTNIALPLSNWTVLGAPSNIAPGLMQFTDTNATDVKRFYDIRSP